MIEFSCENCGRQMKVSESAAGRRGNCKSCNHEIVVPDPSRAIRRANPNPYDAFDPPSPIRTVYIQVPSEPPPPPEPTFPVFAPTSFTEQRVTVNVSHGGSSLGVASVVLGILGLVVCWVPIVGLIGLPLSGLGLLLGLAGLLVSLFRNGRGIGMPIAGSAISALAVAIAISINTVLLSGMVAETQKANQAGRNQPAEPEKLPYVVANNAAKTVPGKAKEPKWADASNSTLRLGDIKFQITKVVVGEVPLKRIFDGKSSESEDELLTLWIKVTNTSESKKVDYVGYMTDFASLRDIDAKLTDDHDNWYKASRFSHSVTVSGANAEDSIYPGKSLTDAVVFEPPIPGAKYLRLVLSGKAVGEDKDLRFEIPATMIERGQKGAQSSTDNVTAPTRDEQPDEKPTPSIASPYKFKERAEDAARDVMDLYSCSSKIDQGKLKAFCEKERETFDKSRTKKRFFYIVIFDSGQNATFPSNPFSAGFPDEDQLTHIRATYGYNFVNGWSELAIYNPNAWSGKRVIVK